MKFVTEALKRIGIHKKQSFYDISKESCDMFVEETTKMYPDFPKFLEMANNTPTFPETVTEGDYFNTDGEYFNTD